MEMCRDSIAPHNILDELIARGMPMGKSAAILACHTGTSDVYLLRAVLRGGIFPAIITAAYNRNFGAHDAYAVIPELAGAENMFSSGRSGGSTVWWASDCYFGASALALQRVLQRYSYSLVAEDGEGKLLIFVRNDLLPSAAEGGAHVPSLMSANWVSKVVKRTSALYGPCHRRIWARVSEGGGGEASELERVLLDHEKEALIPDASSSVPDASRRAGVQWARSSSAHVPYRRAWLVVGEGAAAGWAGDGGASNAGCAGQREVTQHVGTLVRRAGINGSAVWTRAQGNAMVQREARLRELNHAALTHHLATKEGAFEAVDSKGRVRHEEGSNWWSEHHWQQSLSCSVTARVRAPGGSWAVCDPHRMRQCGCVIYTLQTARDVWSGAAGASHELLHSSGTLDGGEGEGGGRGEGAAGGRGEGGEERGLRGRILFSQTRADEVRELSMAVGEGAREKEMRRRGRVEGGGGVGEGRRRKGGEKMMNGFRLWGGGWSRKRRNDVRGWGGRELSRRRIRLRCSGSCSR